VVFERWASEDDLARHFKTPHIAAFREAVASSPRSGRSLCRYYVARSEEFQSSAVAAS
jgi:quinol monooxygenase YgiN